MMAIGTGIVSAALYRHRAAATLLPETTALLARMTAAPSYARVAIIDQLIRALKTAGIWARLDALWLLAAHDAQAARLNAVQGAFDLTAVNSPAFTADHGYKGNGTSAYLATGYIPYVVGGKYLQNDASVGVFVRQLLGGSRYALIANENRVADIDILKLSGGAGVPWLLKLNNAWGNATYSSTTYPASGCLLAGSVDGPSSPATYKDGVADPGTFTSPRTPNGVVSGTEIRLLTSVGGFEFSPSELSVAWLGGALTVTQHAQMNTILRTYLTAVGAI